MRHRLILALAVSLTWPLSGRAGGLVDATFDLPPIDSLQAFVDRPLFAPDRRPDPAAAVKPTGPASGPLVLVGIGRGANGQAVALFSDGQGGTALRLGQDLLGWRLDQVSPKSIELVAADGARRRMSLGDRLGEQ